LKSQTRHSLIIPVGDGFGFIRFVIRFARTMRLVYLDIIPTFEYNKHEKLMKPVGVSFVMDFMTTKQAGELWGISQRRVSILCEQGRINGVKKAGIMWLIPPDTKKPDDGRLKSERAKRGKSK